MSKRFLIATILAFTITASITGSIVWADVMSSANYAIQKITVEGSGGNMASSNFKVGFTVGQTVIGPVSGPGHDADLGFWAGHSSIDFDNFVYLPIVVKNN